MSTPKINASGLLLQFEGSPQNGAGSTGQVPHATTSWVEAAPGFTPLIHKSALRNFGDGEILFSQGDAAERVFYLQKGRIKLAALSSSGKEAVVAILHEGRFFGESALAPQLSARISTATSMGNSTVAAFTAADFRRRLHHDSDFLEAFLVTQLQERRRLETALVSQLLNCTEQRLAQALLQLADLDDRDQPASRIVPRISQETLAHMVGASRARVSSYMKKFRNMGLIECNGVLRIYSALQRVIAKK